VEFSIANRRCRGFTSTKTGSDKSVTRANWPQIQLRKIALFIDIFRFKRLLKKLKVDYVISDRYFFDTVINIEYLSGSRIKCGMTKWIEKYIPKSDLAFYLKVDPEKIMQRERKPDQGMEYLAAKNELFSQKIKDWDMIVINGEKDKEEIFDKIKLQVWGETS
jgi:thymidylate kinase